MTRNFCFTANYSRGKVQAGFPAEDIQDFLNCTHEHGKGKWQIQYCCIGEEGLGEDQTEHWQGFLQTTKAIRWTAVQKLLPKGWKWHWENKRRDSSCDDARDYCKKEGNLFFEWGVFVPSAGQGARTDLEKVAKDARAGLGYRQIAKDNPETWIRYHKGIKSLVDIFEEEKAPDIRDIKVYWLWGVTGSGKSYTAITQQLNGRQVYTMHASNLGKKWWDGYDGEEILVIDEFTSGACNITYLLGLLDTYKLRLAVKDSFTYAKWEEVRVTSNLNFPGEVYPGANNSHRAALFRRVTKDYQFEHNWLQQEAFVLGGEEEEKVAEATPELPTPPPLVRRDAGVKQMAGQPAILQRNNAGFIFEEDLRAAEGPDHMSD